MKKKSFGVVALILVCSMLSFYVGRVTAPVAVSEVVQTDEEVQPIDTEVSIQVEEVAAEVNTKDFVITEEDNDDDEVILAEQVSTKISVPNEILGGIKNYDEDCMFVRSAYWSGEYDGSTKIFESSNGKHVVSVNENGDIWIDNEHYLSGNNIHLDPNNLPVGSREDADSFYHDENGYWVDQHDCIEYWSKGKLVKSISDEKVEGDKYLLDSEHIFICYGETAKILDLSTGEFETIATDVNDVTVDDDGTIKIIRRDWNAYKVFLSGLEKIESNIARFPKTQSVRTEVSDEELRIYNAVKEFWKNDDDRFNRDSFCLSDITGLDSDADTIVSYSRGSDWQLYINNAATGLYMNVPPIGHFSEGANYCNNWVPVCARFFAENGKLYIFQPDGKTLEYDIPKAQGYDLDVNDLDTSYENNMLATGSLESYDINLKVYNEDNTFDLLFYTVNAETGEFAQRTIAENAMDADVDTVYSPYLYYIDSAKNAYRVRYQDKNSVSEKVVGSAYRVDSSDFRCYIVTDEKSANVVDYNGYNNLYFVDINYEDV